MLVRNKSVVRYALACRCVYQEAALRFLTPRGSRGRFRDVRRRRSLQNLALLEKTKQLCMRFDPVALTLCSAQYLIVAHLRL
jgi:hypothetical protein